MKKNRDSNRSISFDNDFFSDIKSQTDVSALSSNSNLDFSLKKKYNIKSSLFHEKIDLNSDLQNKQLSGMELATSIGDIKINDYSFISKIDDFSNSGISTLLFKFNKYI